MLKSIMNPFQMHAHKHAVDDQECLGRKASIFQVPANMFLKPAFVTELEVAQSHVDTQLFLV